MNTRDLDPDTYHQVMKDNAVTTQSLLESMTDQIKFEAAAVEMQAFTDHHTAVIHAERLIKQAESLKQFVMRMN